MARPTLFNSPKFALAQRRLGIPAPHLLGHLEFMWAAANESGNHIFACAEQVEAVAQWTGKEGFFAECLSRGGSNFLDPCSDGSYAIHDYWHHAPDYVQKRRAREMERHKTADDGGFRQTTADNGGQRQTTAENGTPPAPAPAPALKEEYCAEPGSPASTPHASPAFADGDFFKPTTALPFPKGRGPYRIRADDVFMWFPVKDCLDSNGWPFTREHGLQLVERFTAHGEDSSEVERRILNEVKKAHGWLVDRPSRQKTPKGMPSFLADWIARSVNRKAWAA